MKSISPRTGSPADGIQPALRDNEYTESPLSSPKKKRGRPRKTDFSRESAKYGDAIGRHHLRIREADEIKSSLPDNKYIESPINVPKKKRGRPRKIAMSVESVKLDDANEQHRFRNSAANEANPSIPDNELIETPVQAPKKKRGRPRKRAVSVEPVKLDDANELHRFRNSAANEANPSIPDNEHMETPVKAPKKKRGRPSKRALSMESVDFDNANGQHRLQSGSVDEMKPSLLVNASFKTKRGTPRNSAPFEDSVEIDDGSAQHIRPTSRIRQSSNQPETSGATHLAEKYSAPPAPVFEKSRDPSFLTVGSPANRTKTSIPVNEHVEMSLNDSPKRKPGRPRKLVSSVESVNPDDLSGQQLLRTSRVRRLPGHLKDQIILKTRTYQKRGQKEPSTSHRPLEELESQISP